MSDGLASGFDIDIPVEHYGHDFENAPNLMVQAEVRREVPLTYLMNETIAVHRKCCYLKVARRYWRTRLRLGILMMEDAEEDQNEEAEKTVTLLQDCIGNEEGSYVESQDEG